MSTGRLVVITVLLVALSMALIGCAAPLEIQETGRQEYYVETQEIPIDNCGGPAAATFHRLMSKSIRHDVYVENLTDVGLDAFLVSTVVGQRYGFEEGSVETRSTGVELTAPAYSKVVYVLEWREVWAEGIAYDPDTMETYGNWRVRQDLEVQIVHSREEACR